MLSINFKLNYFINIKNKFLKRKEEKNLVLNKNENLENNITQKN